MTIQKSNHRIIQLFIVLFGISFLTFLLVYLSPGDPAEIMLTECGHIPTPELLAQARHDLGLDRPFLTQYGSWLKGVVTGDMGMSYSFKMPVFQKLIQCLLPTLALALLSLAIMLVVSLPLGFLSAVFHNKWMDYVVRGFSFIGISVPSFWIGLVLLRVFGVNLGWVSVSGGSADLRSIILPAVTLALAMSAKYTRQVRITVLEELNKEYVTGARMRGIPERKILMQHVMPNVLLPLVTILGLSFGSLLGGTAVVEIIYNWPGLGNMAVRAIACRDFPLIQGYVLMISLFYMLINLLVDFSYPLIDPRLKQDKKMKVKTSEVKKDGKAYVIEKE
ncbi:ABC transporter permease [Enterococcus sp. 669A]|uniref:Nickel import system permease protein NikB n=1 Tax=Candidatus Enterococcus moelleringii TaxID=2815325 RepID=A0ABS3LEE7_9ENTE|nr:nickel ABC transporter permease [Enterococcus sp. 669A]MBO1308021.1 ABC transporter permease [Enterococcus sp. 669A]